MTRSVQPRATAILKDGDISLEAICKLADNSKLNARITQITNQAAEKAAKLMPAAIMHSAPCDDTVKYAEASAAYMVLKRLDGEIARLPDNEDDRKKHNIKPINAEAVAWALKKTLGINANRDYTYIHALDAIGLRSTQEYLLTGDVRSAIARDVAATQTPHIG